MRYHLLSSLVVVVLLLGAQASAQSVIAIDGGTWSEDYSGGSPGAPGNVVSATITAGSWTISVPSAVLSSFNGGSGTAEDPYDTDYAVSSPAAVITDGTRVLMFSSLTLNNKTVSTPAPQTFTLTTAGPCDAGCYSLSLTVAGEETAGDATGHNGIITGGTVTIALLTAFEGTWCESFGPAGQGSAGGTLSASISGSGWSIELPNAIHQGVVSGSGTPGDPWVSEYEVDASQPATVQYGSITCVFSSLTLTNTNASGVPLFELTASGTDDAGCYDFDITVGGTVDPTSIDSSGMCGSLCGDASLTLLKTFEGTWCESFGPAGPGSAGGTLTASISGAGWSIELPNAIHQGVISGSGAPGDPWVSEYQVDASQPATLTYGSIVCVFSSLTLVNTNASGVPLFELTASGTDDAGCYSLDLSVCGTVDMSSASSSGMCGSLCGDASLTLLRAFEGTWCESFGPEGPGSAGGTLTASMSGSGWSIDLPNAIHQGVVSGSGTPGDPWVSHYEVDPTQPATLQYGSIVCVFSSLTLVNCNASGVPTFDLTATGVCDAGCYELDLTVSGTADMSGASSSGMCGSLAGEASLSLLRMFEGTWCEQFGPEGPGSAGGTLTASMSGSGWAISLPNAIHQGVVSGSGTESDPWVSEYLTDPTQPATVTLDSKVIKFSSLTLVNHNAAGVPIFDLSVSGWDDTGCYLLDLSVCGTADMSGASSSGMCGSLCGQGTLKVALDVSSSAGGDALVPGEETFYFDYGTKVELQAQATDPLFEFLGWRGTIFSDQNPETLLLKTSHRARAVFVSLLDVIYVDDDAAGDPAPGDASIGDPLENGTPEHPFDSVQEAVEVAAPGATVVVKTGTYRENVVIEDKSITVTSIDPEGTGGPEFPVINGNRQGPVVSTMLRVGDPEGFAPELVGLVLTGGEDDLGGGVLCHNGSPIFRNCLIVGNRSKLCGGALFTKDGSPVLIHCTIADNAGPDDCGAGLYGINSDVTVVSSIVWGNQPANLFLDGDCTAAIMFSDVQSGCGGDGNLDADPMFVAAGDYHLLPDSPCACAGDDGTDMGAYGGLD